MKKLITKYVLLAFLLLGLGLTGQTSACDYSTCVPLADFGNLDNFQIYGAILSLRNGSTVVTTGTVSVANTVTMTGNVGGFSAKISSTVNVDGINSASTCVGTIQSFSNCIRPGQKTAILHDLEVYDPYSQSGDFTIDIWSALPTGTFVQNGTYLLNANDHAIYMGSVSVSASDYKTLGGIGRASVSNINLVVAVPVGSVVSGSTIYYTIVLNNSVNYGAGGHIFINAGFLQD